MLVQSKTFAEQTPRAAAFRRAADFFARDDAELWRRAVGQSVPVRNQAAEREPLALLPDTREIAALREPRSAAQSQSRRAGAWRRRTFRRFSGHEHGSNRRQAFASHAAAIGQRGLAAFARITVEKSVLPFAADFRRLILAFHKLFSVLPAEKPERARIPMKRLVSRRG